MADYNYHPGSVNRWQDNKMRTAYWIEDHAPNKVDFYSPNYIPTKDFNGDWPYDPPSDAESSHSLPPKMVLKWNDGRPDEKIGGRRGHSTQTRHKSKLSDSTNKLPTRKVVDTTLPPEPEQIRVLPSVIIPAQTSEHRRNHQRSKSMSTPSTQPEHRDRHSHRSSRHHEKSTRQERPIGPIRDNSYVVIEPASHPVAFTHSQPAPYNTLSGKGTHAAHRSHNQPPPVIYATSNHPRRAEHQLPMVYGPSGMVYSHSASQAQPYHASFRVTPSPGPEDRRNNESSRLAREERKRAQSMRTSSRKEPTRGPKPRMEGEDLDGSMGNYYVHPSHGEKVHIITPGRPVETYHPTAGGHAIPPPLQNTTKRPFLQRLFNMKIRQTGESTSAKSSGSRAKIERRHSIGISQSRHGQTPSTH